MKSHSMSFIKPLNAHFGANRISNFVETQQHIWKGLLIRSRPFKYFFCAEPICKFLNILLIFFEHTIGVCDDWLWKSPGQAAGGLQVASSYDQPSLYNPKMPNQTYSTVPIFFFKPVFFPPWQTNCRSSHSELCTTSCCFPLVSFASSAHS